MWAVVISGSDYPVWCSRNLDKANEISRYWNNKFPEKYNFSVVTWLNK